jgi:hypothetical protein
MTKPSVNWTTRDEVARGEAPDEVAGEVASRGVDDVVELELGTEMPADRAERTAVLPRLERRAARPMWMT